MKQNGYLIFDWEMCDVCCGGRSGAILWSRASKGSIIGGSSIIGASSYIAAVFLDRYEGLYLELSCCSLARSTAVQFGLAGVYGVTIAGTFRAMLFATYELLLWVEKDDFIRTYGNAFWLIALANLHSLERMICDGG